MYWIVAFGVIGESRANIGEYGTPLATMLPSHLDCNFYICLRMELWTGTVTVNNLLLLCAQNGHLSKNVILLRKIEKNGLTMVGRCINGILLRYLCCTLPMFSCQK